MVELKVHLPSPGMTPSRRRDRYSRDKSLLRKREQSKLEDWANTKCMSFSKNKCKALHVGWNKPQQRPRLGSHSLRCLWKCWWAESWTQVSSCLTATTRATPVLGCIGKGAFTTSRDVMTSLCHTQNTGFSWEFPHFERHWQTGEGHGGPPSQRGGWKIGGMGTGWRNGVCSAKRNGGLEDLIKLVIFKR